MNDIIRIILTLLVNGEIENMEGHVADFLNGEYDHDLEAVRDELARLQEHVQEHIDYRADMNAHNDECFMQFTEEPQPPFGAPENDIISSMEEQA